MALTTQQIVELSKTVNAAQLGNGEAVRQFREAHAGAYKLPFSYSKDVRSNVESFMDKLPVIWTEGPVPPHDHPVLYCLREIHRQILLEHFNIYTTDLRTQIMGASMREVKKYNNNPSVFFYVHCTENKDISRFCLEALSSICTTLKKKAGKNNKKIFLNEGECSKNRKLKRYTDLRALTNDMEAIKAGLRISLDVLPANVLVYEDSGYSNDEKGWLEVFRKTGATMALGYGMMPLELLFKEFPGHGEIKFRKIGSRGVVTFPAGFSNGYSHDLHSWGTIYRSPFIDGSKYGYSFSLEVEITARTGPMVSYKILKVSLGAIPPVRSIGLLKSERYYKVLSVFDSYDSGYRKFSRKGSLKYYTVKCTYVDEIITWANSLNPGSLNFNTLASYIRKRTKGVATVNVEVLPPWDISADRVVDLALLMTLYLSVLREAFDPLMDKENKEVTKVCNFMSWWENFLAKFGKGKIATMFKTLFSDFQVGDYDQILSQLMLTPLEDEVFQDPTGAFRLFGGFRGDTHQDFDMTVYGGMEYGQDLPDCHICLDYPIDWEDQILNCCYKDKKTNHVFKMSSGEIAALKASMTLPDGDPMAVFLREAKKNVPDTEFAHECEVVYISAGPGCGKSRCIREMATKADLILSPFSKLAVDYSDKEDGMDKYNFKTQHRALQLIGKEVIFVDEFTAYDYRLLAVTVFKNQAKRVFLVGDEKQTRILPNEGVYIGDKIPLKEVNTHQLLVNFRNPPLTVAYLNDTYGYTMQSARMSDLKASDKFTVVTLEEAGQSGFEGLAYHGLAFSTASAAENLLDEKATVRAAQGTTYDKLKLFVVERDESCLTSSELRIVAMSRHKTDLIIIGDGSVPSIQFTQGLSLTGEQVLLNREKYFPVVVNLERPRNQLDAAEVTEYLKFTPRACSTGISCCESSNESGDFEGDETLAMEGQSDSGVPAEDSFNASAFLGMDEEPMSKDPKVVAMRNLAFAKAVLELMGNPKELAEVFSEIEVDFVIKGKTSRIPKIYDKIFNHVSGLKDNERVIFADLFKKLFPAVTHFGPSNYDFADQNDVIKMSKAIYGQGVKFLNSIGKVDNCHGKLEKIFKGKNFDDFESSDRYVVLNFLSADNLLGTIANKQNFKISVPIRYGSLTIRTLEKFILPFKIKFVPVNQTFMFLELDIIQDFKTFNSEVFDELMILLALGSQEGKLVDHPLFRILSADEPKTFNHLRLGFVLTNLLDDKYFHCDIDRDLYCDFGTNYIFSTSEGVSFPFGEDFVPDLIEYLKATRLQLQLEVVVNYSKRFLKVFPIGISKDAFVDNYLRVFSVIPLVYRERFLMNTCEIWEGRKIAWTVVKENPEKYTLPFKERLFEVASVNSMNEEIAKLSVRTEKMPDPEFFRAKKERFGVSRQFCFGFMNRAAPKILEIASMREWSFSGKKILDMCSAPGGWTQYVNKFSENCTILSYSGKGEGLLEPRPMVGENNNVVSQIYNDELGDIRTNKTQKYLIDHAESSELFDFVLADGGTSSRACTEVVNALPIWSAEIKVASRVLKPGGSMVIKLLDPMSPHTVTTLIRLFKMFETGSLYKPYASAPLNSEFYFVGENHKSEARTAFNLSMVRGLLQLRLEAFRYLHGEQETFVRPMPVCLAPFSRNVREAHSMQLPCFSQAASGFSDGSDFATQHHIWAPALGTAMRNLDLSLPNESEKREIDHPAADSHVMIEELFPPGAVGGDYPSNNLIQSQLVLRDSAKMKIDGDELLNPTNNRGMLTSTEKKFFSMGASVGNHYSDGKPFQTMNVMATRYLNQAKSIPSSGAGVEFARQLVANYFYHCVNKDIVKARLNDEGWIDEILTKFMADSEVRNYKQRFEGVQGSDMQSPAAIRFNLKQIFKPRVTNDTDKVGQGISAWSIATCVTYCGASRVIGALVSEAEKANICTDSFKPTVEFVESVKTAFAKVVPTAEFAVTDANMFDAYQNWFTQEIEKAYWRELGISEGFLDSYYSFRKHYFIGTRSVSGTANMQKTSGEPLTLVNNGIVSKVVSFNMFKWEGEFAMVYKGDDFALRAANIERDQAVVDELAKFCNLSLKVYIGPEADFCGLAVVDGDMVPNIRRTFTKLAGHRFRDYAHFCEYQISLRDWVGFVEKLGLEKVLASNCVLNKVSYEQIRNFWDAVVAVSHLNEGQFFERFKFYKEQALFCYRDNGKMFVSEM